MRRLAPIAAVLTLWLLFVGSLAVGATPGEPPVIATSTTLYDGTLGSLPGAQGFLYLTNPIFGAAATQAPIAGGVRLTTTAVRTEQAGYFGRSAAVPVLDRAAGYVVRFTAQVVTESHVSPHRAGFSLIALSSDTRGIELAFWTDEVWAQEGGSPPTLFTHAEGTTFDTTAGPTRYELTVRGDRYALTANGAPLLDGPLRDYSAFTGPSDVYETPNFIFLGDDTSSAQAVADLWSVQVGAAGLPGGATVAEGDPLRLPLAFLDLDAGTAPISVTLQVDHGTLTVAADVAGGLPASAIGGNGTGLVRLVGPVAALNSTVATAQGALYRNAPGFAGRDLLRVIASDEDGGGDVRTMPITVTAAPRADLGLAKAAHSRPLFPGGRVTYTLVLHNAGPAIASSVVLTDLLPAGVLSPTVTSSGAAITQTGSGPLVWQVADLAPGAVATLTLTASLDAALAPGGTLTNTATLGGALPDPLPGDNGASAVSLLIRCPDLSPPTGVDVTDLSAIAAHWHSTPSTPGWSPASDLDSSGEVTIVDIMLTVAAWGRTCGD